MRSVLLFFSLFLLYIADSMDMVHVQYVSCEHIYDVSCHICITFLNRLPWIFFSYNIENVTECCKAE